MKLHSSAQIISTPLLRERNLGIFEGQPNTEWRKAMEISGELFHSFRPEQGESYMELQKRVREFYRSILKKHPHSSVLLVGHAGTLTILILTIPNHPITYNGYNKYKLMNSAITIIEIIEDKQPKVSTLNNIDHLLKTPPIV